MAKSPSEWSQVKWQTTFPTHFCGILCIEIYNLWRAKIISMQFVNSWIGLVQCVLIFMGRGTMSLDHILHYMIQKEILALVRESGHGSKQVSRPKS